MTTTEQLADALSAAFNESGDVPAGFDVAGSTWYARANRALARYDAEKPQELDFDPVDLAQLAAGWGPNLSITESEYLTDVARMLHRLWKEQADAGDWDGVWAYEVADPLGTKLRRSDLNSDTDPLLRSAEAIARRLIAGAFNNGVVITK